MDNETLEKQLNDIRDFITQNKLKLFVFYNNATSQYEIRNLYRKLLVSGTYLVMLGFISGYIHGMEVNNK